MIAVITTSPVFSVAVILAATFPVCGSTVTIDVSEEIHKIFFEPVRFVCKYSEAPTSKLTFSGVILKSVADSLMVMLHASTSVLDPITPYKSRVEPTAMVTSERFNAKVSATVTVTVTGASTNPGIFIV